MKIAIAQQNYFIGDFEGNRNKIIATIHEARKKKADLVLFSELCICGYPPRDFLEFHDFIEQCNRSIEIIAKETKGIAVLVGAPSVNDNPKGKDLFNSAYFISNEKVQQVIHKSLLPNYDVFDEYRYFEPNREFHPVDFMGRTLSLTVCEDIWNYGTNPLYIVSPVEQLNDFHPDYMLNISASPFDYRKAQERIGLLKELTSKYNLPIFYCNTVGAQTELIFDGGSLIVNAKGEVFDELPYFEECLRMYDLDEVMKSRTNSSAEQPKEKIQLIHEALITGIRDYFFKMKFEKAILGLSGGLDSAVVAALAAEALGKKNVKALLLPSKFSSSHSISDSEKLVKNLGIQSETISIAKHL